MYQVFTMFWALLRCLWSIGCFQWLLWGHWLRFPVDDICWRYFPTPRRVSSCYRWTRGGSGLFGNTQRGLWQSLRGSQQTFCFVDISMENTSAGEHRLIPKLHKLWEPNPRYNQSIPSCMNDRKSVTERGLNFRRLSWGHDNTVIALHMRQFQRDMH